MYFSHYSIPNDDEVTETLTLLCTHWERHEPKVTHFSGTNSPTVPTKPEPRHSGKTAWFFYRRLYDQFTPRQSKLPVWEGDFAKHRQFHLPDVPALWQIREKRLPCLLSSVLESVPSLHSSVSRLFRIFSLLPRFLLSAALIPILSAK